MARWLWYFYWYSFLGFLLEVAFAQAIGEHLREGGAPVVITHRDKGRNNHGTG